MATAPGTSDIDAALADTELPLIDWERIYVSVSAMLFGNLTLSIVVWIWVGFFWAGLGFFLILIGLAFIGWGAAYWAGKDVLPTIPAPTS
jgi:hypothetical protein